MISIKQNFLLLTVFLLIVSNLYSQNKLFDELFVKHNKIPLPSIIIETGTRLIENKASKNLFTIPMQIQDFDVTAVVDNAIEILEDGEKFRYTYTYNSVKKMISKLDENWNGTQWENRFRWTFNYDSNESIASFLAEKWNGTQWVKDWRESYTYNSNQNKTSFLHEENWDGTQWVYRSRETYTYDSNENIILGVSEQWENGNWIGYDAHFDLNDPFENVYNYWGAEINISYGGTTGVSDSTQGIQPHIFRLNQNYPNPFNPTTTISFTLPERSNVNLTVYNILGKKVKTIINNQEKESGIYKVTFSGQGLTNGIYLVRLTTDKFISVKKIMLLK